MPSWAGTLKHCSIRATEQQQRSRVGGEGWQTDGAWRTLRGAAGVKTRVPKNAQEGSCAAFLQQRRRAELESGFEHGIATFLGRLTAWRRAFRSGFLGRARVQGVVLVRNSRPRRWAGVVSVEPRNSTKRRAAVSASTMESAVPADVSDLL
ncbi:hypothetical protein BC567DRAFT_229788 [Phyllosticta citribraziliensis]